MSRMGEMAAEQEQDDSEAMFFFTVEMERLAMDRAEGIIHECARKEWEEMIQDKEFEKEYNEILDREVGKCS